MDGTLNNAKVNWENETIITLNLMIKKDTNLIRSSLKLLGLVSFPHSDQWTDYGSRQCSVHL